MKKELLAIFNKLRGSLGFAAIAEDKHEEFSIEKEFIEKAQTAIESATTLKTQVDALTADVATANTAKGTAETALATEKTAHQATKDLLATEKAAHDKLKGTAAGATNTEQIEADNLDGNEKKVLNSWEQKAAKMSQRK